MKKIIAEYEIDKLFMENHPDTKDVCIKNLLFMCTKEIHKINEFDISEEEVSIRDGLFKSFKIKLSFHVLKEEEFNMITNFLRSLKGTSYEKQAHEIFNLIVGTK